MGSRAVLGLAVAALLAAALIDLAFAGAFTITPLYILPVLMAALYLTPRPVCAIAATAAVTAFADSAVQGTPLLVSLVTTASILISGYLAVLSSQQRERSQQLARAAERHAREAEAASQRLQEFLGMVSHDLRSPLTSLLGYTQLLEAQADIPAQEVLHRALPAMGNAVRRITRLADDLLDMARIGAGRFTVRPAATDLVAITRDIAALQQTAAGGRQIVLDAPDRLDGMWDRERIGQALGNLISNAVKYSPPDRDVKVTVQPCNSEVIISVADRGPGIPAEELPYLFQPFTRLPGGRLQDGTGLGLHITQAIAEAHGGRIWVETAAGKGSTFYLTLPLTVALHALVARP